MLGNFGLAILSFMLAMYALNVLYGVIFTIVYLVKKMGMDAAKTIAYVILLGMTTALIAAAFLKMHGSYSDMERLMIILLCVVNIILMIIFAITRVKVLAKAANQTSQDTPESNTDMDA